MRARMGCGGVDGRGACCCRRCFAGITGSSPVMTLLARLRGFADFKEVRSLFINEIDGKVFTTSGGEDDGGGGDSGRRLGR